MRPEYVPLYGGAMRRKSMLAVKAWLAAGGDTVIPKTLAALRANPCKDGEALVKLVQQTTGVDLSKELTSK